MPKIRNSCDVTEIMSHAVRVEPQFAITSFLNVSKLQVETGKNCAEKVVCLNRPLEKFYFEFDAPRVNTGDVPTVGTC